FLSHARSSRDVPMNNVHICTKVQAALNKFCSYLAPPPRVPALEVVLVDDKDWSDEERQKYRKQHRYHAKCGAYLHYSKTGESLYVGRAFSKNQRLDRARKHDWGERQWIEAILVKKDLAFLIPSLEVFLIWELKPKY